MKLTAATWRVPPAATRGPRTPAPAAGRPELKRAAARPFNVQTLVLHRHGPASVPRRGSAHRAP